MVEDIRTSLEKEHKELKKKLPNLEIYRSITTFFLVFLIIGAFTIDVTFFFILFIPLIFVALIRRDQTSHINEVKDRIKHLEKILTR